MRTWFQRVGHAQAVAAEDVDAALPAPCARISRASCTLIFSVGMKIFVELGVDADQLDHAVVGGADGGR